MPSIDPGFANKLGAKLGIGVCLLGFAFMFFGWNGAASFDRVPSQIPYLISGGFVGLGLVVLGAALILVETAREERTQLREELEHLRLAVGQAQVAPGNTPPAPQTPSGRGQYVSGERSFHLPSCRLVAERADLPRIGRDEAVARALSACRVCEPTAAGKATARR